MVFLLGLFFFFFFLIFNFPSHRVGGPSWTKDAGGQPIPNMFESEGDLIPPPQPAR